MDETSVRKEMSSVIDLVNSDVSTIRTGRVTSSLVENIVIPAYGGTQKLKVVELASISIPDPETIIIEPWDKSVIGEIRQGILASNIGFNPVIDGEIIRVTMPPLTTEDRQKFVKLLGTKLEQGKVMIRRIRGDVMHNIKKDFEAKTISEDEKFREEKRIQEITDEFIEKISAIGESKEKELLQG
jgi:ribosome recycling factor